MKEHIQKLKEGWNNLSIRDKRIALVGGSVLAIFLIYELGWSVLANQVTNMRVKIERDQQTLAAIKKTDEAIQKLAETSRKQINKITPVALLGVVQKQIDKNGLGPSLTQLKQGTNETIELHFQKVNFDKLIAVLIDTMNDQHITISQMAASAGDGEGLVNADIVLKTD